MIENKTFLVIYGSNSDPTDDLSLWVLSVISIGGGCERQFVRSSTQFGKGFYLNNLFSKQIISNGNTFKV